MFHCAQRLPDAALGNPPWEKVQFTESEFFAVRQPDIATTAGAKRKALIRGLQQADPALWAEFQAALRGSEAESVFFRTSGRYPLCGRGKINTYAVFAETMRDALAPAGRLGVIVPTGIATMDTTKDFFADCNTRRRLVSLYSFENSAGLFADVHRDFKFCLLTLTGRSGGVEAAQFVFFAHHPSDLRDQERRFTLSPADLELINPNTRTAPVFRSRRDAELTRKIYHRIPVLVREGGPDGNPWGVEFQQGLFNMTSDSGLFLSAAELGERGAELDGNVWRKGSDAWLPLYEAKMVHQFNHRWGDYSMQPAGSGDVQLPDVPDERLADPNYVVQPRYWVAESEVHDRLHGPANWLLGFRDITNATNERTMIASALPFVAAGNNEPLLLTATPPTLSAVLPALMNSFVFDYCTRHKVGWTHINFFIAKQLPVILPRALQQPISWSGPQTVAEWMRPRVLELTYTAVDMAGFAADLGYDGPPFGWDPERRRQLRAELDAACFHLYGLNRDEVDYVMDTFPVVRRRDEAAHGEYLTKRLILEQYEYLNQASTATAPPR